MTVAATKRPARVRSRIPEARITRFLRAAKHGRFSEAVAACPFGWACEWLPDCNLPDTAASFTIYDDRVPEGGFVAYGPTPEAALLACVRAIPTLAQRLERIR